MIELIAHTTELLQTFSSSAVTFATADNSIAATGIGTAFPDAGTKMVITGAAQPGNNSTFTIVSAAAGKIIVSETVTAELPTAAVVINQEWQSGYKQSFQYQDLVGGVKASQNCTVYVDQSTDKSSACYPPVPLSVSGGTPMAFEIRVVAPYVQFRIRNSGTNQTEMNGYLNGARR